MSPSRRIMFSYECALFDCTNCIICIYFTHIMKYNGGNMNPLIVPVISFFGFLAFAAVALTLLVLLIDRAFGTRIIGRIQSRTVRFADSAVFGSALIATLASLTLSEILRFPPCVLCWYQRIFMYVQVPLTYLAITRRELSLLKPYLIV